MIPTDSDQHGVSVFVREGARVFHPYSAYGVGTDVILSKHYRFLDLTPVSSTAIRHRGPGHDTNDDAQSATLASSIGG